MKYKGLVVKISRFVAVLTISLLGTWAHAADVEVLHWWTASGEARSVDQLRKIVAAHGVGWKDFAVAGGGGTNAMAVLRARVLADNPPTAAQIKGPALQEWGYEGLLANLDGIAQREKWDAILPPAVSQIMKYEGHYVAVPVNIHRVNWLWINADVLKRVGVNVPTTLPELFDAAEKIKKAGITPIAHGGQPWQDATLFEVIVLAVGGVDFYRQALVNLDQRALNSPTMVAVFDTLTRLKSYMGKGVAGRDWNLATALVVNGKEAAMQFMGDWAKGEFVAAGKVAGKDYYCVPVPGTAQAFIFNIDSLAMFKLATPAAQKAQMILASSAMSPQFQTNFSLNKGSIPARQEGIVQAQFDSCAIRSMEDMRVASKEGHLLPSLAHNMALPPATEGAMVDVIAHFMNANMSSAKAVQRLAKAAKIK